MKIAALLEELDLSIDDVRWYLALQETERLLQLKDRPQELTRLLWSGALEKDLYNMEERFLAELERELTRGRRDEAAVREHLRRVAASRGRRYAAALDQP